jgi:hypothetical protein
MDTNFCRPIVAQILTVINACDSVRICVGGHPKCTTFGHLKVHHFLDGKAGSD